MKIQILIAILILSFGCAKSEKNPYCGDNILQEESEECDGSDFGNITCLDLGYYGGSMECSEECKLILGDCQVAGRCGDGILHTMYGEECEGSELNGETCPSLGLGAGELACNSECDFDTSGCENAELCGNSTIDGSELCDGNDLNGSSCISLGYDGGGDLSCDGNCQFDTSSCISGGVCGDNTVDTGEECDGNNLNGEDCSSLDSWFGNLSCASCSYDMSGCHNSVLSGGSGGEITYGSSSAPNGEFIVAGYIDAGSFSGNSSAGLADCIVAKYDSQGSSLWGKQWGSTQNDFSYATTHDSNGNIFVTGQAGGSIDGETYNGGSSDGFLTKFSSSGTKLWTKLLGTSVEDYSRSLAVDSFGNVYIAGITSGDISSSGAKGGKDIFLAKFDTNGNSSFIKQYGTASDDVPINIMTDSSNNIYITGYTSGTMGAQSFGSSDIFLMKLDSGGNQVWTKQWGTTAQDQGNSISHDSNGNLYIIGITSGSLNGNTGLGGMDMFLMKIASSNGSALWTKQWGSNVDDQAWSVKYRSDNAIYVAGHSSGVVYGQPSVLGQDAVVTKFDSTGSFVHSNTIGGNGNDYCNYVILGVSDGVFCTGTSDGDLPGATSGGSYDLFIIKFPD